MTKMHEVAELGQSIWLDFIRRSFITSGELQELIDAGLRGITSNPSIFEKAIVDSADYDVQLHSLVGQGRPLDAIYQALVIEDIQRAADLLRPVYDRSAGGDGYVSLEASPELAHDTQGTIDEVRHLCSAVDRPNVMFKVPATRQGMPAIQTLIGEGININVTLIFGLDQYEDVAEAYLSGLEELAESTGRGAMQAPLAGVASVASFFVSRVDTAVDKQLESMGGAGQALKGKIAIANAKVAYARFQHIFSGERWDRLARQGARVQRVLWGSTSTKNPAYPDTYYVDNLIGPDTVNTVPPETLQAFLDHGKVAITLEYGLGEARQQLDRLSELGVDLDSVTQKLLDDGVRAFANAFSGLMRSIAHRRDQIQSGTGEVG
jgi:transaldolase